MAARASGNSRITFAAALSAGPLGYAGLGPLPMNCARIASRKSLTSNPSWVVADTEVPTSLVFNVSFLANMGVLSPFMVLGFYGNGRRRGLVCLQTRQMRTDASHQRRAPLKDLS